MKLKHLLFGFLVAGILAVACDKKPDDVAPRVEIKGLEDNTLTFSKDVETKTITMRASRDWRVTAEPASAIGDDGWLNLPLSGEATSSDGKKISITAVQNDGYTREAKLTFKAGTAKKTITVKQEGEKGENPNPGGIETISCADFIAKADTETEYRLVGTIVENPGYNDKFWGFAMSDDEGVSVVNVAFYNDKENWGPKLKKGGKVTVTGKYSYYDAKGQHQIKNGTIEAFEAGTGGDDNNFGTPAGDGTAASPYNVAAINEITSALASGATSEQEYYMAGTVAKIREVSATHGNASFDIKDDDADGTFYIFRCKYIGGENFVSEDQIKVGDKVVVKGYVTNYMGNTPETTQGAEIISINGGTEVTKVLSVSTKELTAIADDESATFKVGGNVAWTASVTEGSEFVKILSGASGNGAGDVVLELSKNTADTPRTAKITVTTTEDVAEKSIEVVLTQLKKGEVPAGANITWAKTDWTGSSATYTLTKDGYTITIDKAAGGTNPALRDDNSVRLYAKGLLTISGPAFTSVEIVLAGDAGYRYCPVTADSGTVGAQAAGDKSVYWTGSASTVVFTVGDNAEYGSDGAAKAGQLRFVGINIK